MSYVEGDIRVKHEEEDNIQTHEEDFIHRSPFGRFILKNFLGANVTLTFVNGQTNTGEVVGDFDNVIGLKNGNTITFINERFIVTLV
jgi:hypothetical protein